MGGLDDMKRWCEEHSDCVGFAMQPESLRWFPKKVGTGFDAGKVTWTSGKWRGQVWRWYYIQGRGEASTVEVSAKFEQHRASATSPVARRQVRQWPLLAEAMFFASLAFLLLSATLTAVRTFARASTRTREDYSATYLALHSTSTELRLPVRAPE
mmetsp:Transcript_70565/g.220288  ORF Transcript_70565/g.220288 Transcript_70565/m.220288 type:complete len:155 (+) Transcript_70565:234-698(+)